MKTKLFVFLLAASLAAWGQHTGGHSGGHTGAAPTGSSTGSEHGSMHDTTSGSHGSSADHAGSKHSNIGGQSPDTILSNNSHLSSKLETMLPKGMTAQQACSGFKNLGQCVAAVHVSNNLGISFTALKDKMTGGESLGKAIHDLKPGANAKAEEKKGKKQADDDLKES